MQDPRQWSQRLDPLAFAHPLPESAMAGLIMGNNSSAVRAAAHPCQHPETPSIPLLFHHRTPRQTPGDIAAAPARSTPPFFGKLQSTFIRVARRHQSDSRMKRICLQGEATIMGQSNKKMKLTWHPRKFTNTGLETRSAVWLSLRQ